MKKALSIICMANQLENFKHSNAGFDSKNLIIFFCAGVGIYVLVVLLKTLPQLYNLLMESFK